MVTMPFETIILSERDITEPEYAVRYMRLQNIDGNDYYRVEFYDNVTKTILEGGTLDSLAVIETKPHLFDYCPLQGIPNNLELMGDTEKVEELIDAYDRAVSDSNNEIESFANAYMVFENINMSKEAIDAAIRDAEMHAEEDKKRKEVVDNKNSLDQLIAGIEKVLTRITKETVVLSGTPP